MVNSQEDEKKSKVSVIATIIGVIVVLGLIALLIYIMMDDKEAKPSNVQQEYNDIAETTSSDENTITYNGKTYQYNEHLSNFLFMGIDAREKVETKEGQANAGQADAIFLLSWDRVKHNITMISIPRDTMTQIETFSVDGESLGKSTDHLSLAYAFGDGGTKSCELMKTAVSNLLYQVPIQGYAAVNLDGLPILAKGVDGVPITVPDDSLEKVNPEMKQGANITLNEDNIETFVRYRDITKDQSAIVRLNRQKVFLDAYQARAIEKFNEDQGFITDLYTELQEYMVTNIGTDQFAKIMEDASKDGTKEKLTLPGEAVEGTSFDEYHVDDEKLYEMILQVFYEETE